jgi:hypothetical protein
MVCSLELSMRYETLTLGGNVIRFPMEVRAKPSIDLLIDVAPDSREVELIAEAFGFDAPDPEGRAKADRKMAEQIAEMAMELPVDGGRRGRGRRAKVCACSRFVLHCLLGIAAAWMGIGDVRTVISIASALPTVNGPQRSVSRESVAAAKRKDTAQASITTCCA